MGVTNLQNNEDVKEFIQKHTLVQIQYLLSITSETASPDMKKFLRKCLELYPKVPAPGSGKKAVACINEDRMCRKAAYERGEAITDDLCLGCGKNKVTKPESKVVSGLTPCSQCGSIDFLRTGTCHVCNECGSSQGCS